MKRKPKVLLFRNIFYSPNKEENSWMSQATFYLASALRKAQVQVVFSSLKMSPDDNFKKGLKELKIIFKENPDINFIGISLCEDFFEKARELVRFIRKRSNAFIGIGGVMPTLSPAHVFMHLSDVNFLVRGFGEEVFPRLLKILNSKNINSPLTEKDKSRLCRIKGFAFRNKHCSFVSALDKVNEPQDYDSSRLDFSLIAKDDLSEGLNLFTSRGCFNNCFFCTTPGKGKYIAKSFDNLKEILRDYHKRLRELFDEEIPPNAFKISFNDDDFLADDKRARAFFLYLKNQPFRINFFQAGINSFFKRKQNAGYCATLNPKLISSLSCDIFSSPRGKIYIGTENFCDDELARLGKGYDFAKIEKAVKALSDRKIRQAHHFIASNQLTTPQNLLDSLVKAAVLKIRYGEYFTILTPIIPYLVSLYPSPSYKMIMLKKRTKFLNIRSHLSLKSHPEYNYPLVDNDIPINKVTRAMIPMLHKLFLRENNYLNILDLTLFNLLLLRERMPRQRKEITQIIDRYQNYPSLIFKKSGLKVHNDRNNLQLMISRRCHLRCRYCPVVKRNADMSEEVLYKAIDLLFTSSKRDLRLDFTGGEPLLRFDLVQKAVQYARKLAARKNKNISFYLVTNLIALNDNIADFLQKNKFFLELSVDGEEKFHNLYKVGHDRHVNPYRLTVAQLDRIFSRKIENYAVMVASPLTVKYLGRNFYHLLKLGFRKIGINYALGLPWKDNDRKEFFYQMDLIKKRFYPHIKRGIIKLNNLESRVEPAILNSEIMVDVNGDVHLLTDWLFESRTKIIAPPLGRIGRIDDINDIFLSRFKVLYGLLKYCPSSQVKKVIFNNIHMGSLVKEYFNNF